MAVTSAIILVRSCATSAATTAMAHAIAAMPTTRAPRAVVIIGAAARESVGSIDGATGSPSVVDASRISWAWLGSGLRTA